VATLLPMTLVVAMAIDMKRYTPNSTASPSSGRMPVAATVAANTTKLPPETVAAPFEVSSIRARMLSCWLKSSGTL
jgi:hypothetical protein